MTTEIVVSQKLQELIDKFADACKVFASPREFAQELLKQAELDDIGNDELRTLLENALRDRGLSERQILRYIPSGLKDPVKITARLGHKNTGNSDDIMSSDNSRTRQQFTKETKDDMMSSIVAKTDRQDSEDYGQSDDGDEHERKYARTNHFTPADMAQAPQVITAAAKVEQEQQRTRATLNLKKYGQLLSINFRNGRDKAYLVIENGEVVDVQYKVAGGA